METLQINYQPSIKEKLMTFLNSFDSNEVEIISKDLFFEENKKILHERLKEIRNGNSNSISIEEYEIIVENENR